MKKGLLIFLLFLFAFVFKAAAQRADTIKSHAPTTAINNVKITAPYLTHADSVAAHKRDSTRIALLMNGLSQKARSLSTDSLKTLLKHTYIDTFKAPLYTELASRYMAFDSVSSAEKIRDDQNEALNYTMLALHQYSAFHYPDGLRVTFDALAKIYMAEKKYSQAKWFILQSNTLSRDNNDVPNIIASLQTLAEIKTRIKDYKLARGDLDEALVLSAKNHYSQTELDILKQYALMYSRMGDYSKEAVMQKKYDSLAHKIKSDEAALLAKTTADNLSKKKKQDTVQSKKKAHTSTVATHLKA